MLLKIFHLNSIWSTHSKRHNWRSIFPVPVLYDWCHHHRYRSTFREKQFPIARSRKDRQQKKAYQTPSDQFTAAGGGPWKPYLGKTLPSLAAVRELNIKRVPHAPPSSLTAMVTFVNQRLSSPLTTVVGDKCSSDVAAGAQEATTDKDHVNLNTPRCSCLGEWQLLFPSQAYKRFQHRIQKR